MEKCQSVSCILSWPRKVPGHQQIVTGMRTILWTLCSDKYFGLGEWPHWICLHYLTCYQYRSSNPPKPYQFMHSALNTLHGLYFCLRSLFSAAYSCNTHHQPQINERYAILFLMHLQRKRQWGSRCWTNPVCFYSECVHCSLFTAWICVLHPTDCDWLAPIIQSCGANVSECN